MQHYLPILGYHRIGPLRDDHVPTLTKETFAYQIEYLSKWGYRVLNCDEVADSLLANQALPKKSTVITFDDGYEDNLTVAWPILKQYGFTGIVFIVVEEMGTPGFLTWDQVRELHREGMLIGSHTLTHCYIPETDPKQLPGEILESKRVIEEQLQAPVRHLSYPIGGFSKRAQELAQEANYDTAYTTNRAFDKQKWDRYGIRRVKMTEKDRSCWRMMAKLSGYYDALRKLPQP